MENPQFMNLNEENIGPADRDREGAYRRGYHQAINMAAQALKKSKPITADELAAWVENEGMKWRKDVTLERMITPPPLD